MSTTYARDDNQHVVDAILALIDQLISAVDGKCETVYDDQREIHTVTSAELQVYRDREYVPLSTGMIFAACLGNSTLRFVDKVETAGGFVTVRIQVPS